MTWNYRLMRREYQNPLTRETEVVYGIYEVYYDKDGEVNGWSKDPENVLSESVDGIQWMVEKFSEALGKPILEYKDERCETSDCNEKGLEDATG